MYQIQRQEDRRLRYRLRLGPFANEDEADAVLKKVRDVYPGALTATADADDLRAIENIMAKNETARAMSQRSAERQAEKTAEKSAEKSAEKFAEKPAVKAVDAQLESRPAIALPPAPPIVLEAAATAVVPMPAPAPLVVATPVPAPAIVPTLTTPATPARGPMPAPAILPSKRSPELTVAPNPARASAVPQTTETLETRVLELESTQDRPRSDDARTRRRPDPALVCHSIVVVAGNL